MQVVLTGGAALLLLLLGACSADPQADDTANVGPGGGGMDALPDLISGLDTGGCEDFEGQPIPGAARYFHGEYNRGPSTWTGVERWLIYANPTWAEGEGHDCQVVWTTEGAVGDAGGCAGCDVSLAVEAVVDAGATTCTGPLAAIWEGEDVWSASYGVSLASDGDATWFFAGGSSVFGIGGHNADAANFISTKGCMWF